MLMKWQSYCQLAIKETRNARGKLLFSVFSIILGVASITAVRTIILSSEASSRLQARNLMGADLSIHSTTSLKGRKDTLFTDLDQAGLESTSMIKTKAMLQHRQSNLKQIHGTLVNVYAVEQAFPFYGKAKTKPPEKWESLISTNRPNILIDPDLLYKLKLKIGDRVFLGKQAFTVLAAIVKEAGSPLSSYSIVSSVYIHSKYLHHTGLIQRGSRVSYRRLYKAPADFDVTAWKAEHFGEATKKHFKILTYHESAGNLQRILVRFSTFLTIISLITLLLSGAGVGSALSIFMKDKQKNVAIFRNLGLTPQQVFWIYFILAMGLGLFGSLLGAMLGSLLPFGLSGTSYFRGLVQTTLPFAVDIGLSWPAFFYGVFSGLCTTLIFILLPVWRLRQISPIRILRKDAGWSELSTKPKEILILSVFFILAFVLCLGMAASQLSSLYDAFWFAICLPIVLGLLFFFSWLVSRCIRFVLPYIRSYNIRQGLANLYRPNNQTTLMITSLSTGIFLLGSILVFEASFQKELNVGGDRKDTPNNFVINALPDQYDSIQEILNQTKAKKILFSPMVSGRLSAINGNSIKIGKAKQVFAMTRADRLRVRDNFMAYRSNLLDSERVVKGKFWQGPTKEQELSVDERWAKEMDVDLGDTISFDIEGFPITAKITSMRRVRWQSMQPNTMLLLSPGQIKQAPYIYMGSYATTNEKMRLDIQHRLLERYPNLTILNLTEIVKSVSLIASQISWFMRFLAIFALINGGLILMGAVYSSHFMRVRESMLLKVLGARPKTIYSILLSEYIALAILASLYGLVLAHGINSFVLDSFFKASPVMPYLYLAGLGLLLIFANVMLGLLVGRDVLRASPLSVLRSEVS